MHIPDNYLSPSTCIILGVTMGVVCKKSVDKIKKEFTREKIPLLATCSAFSFLIMMLNIPLPGGTSGHIVGATLVSLLVGPYAAIVSITITLFIQAVFFGDGGILSIGANAFNMAFAIPVVGFYVFTFLKRKFVKKDFVAAFISGYISLNIAALLTAIEFGIQPLLFKDSSGLPLYCPYDLKVSIPAMLIPHLLIVGVIEGLVTAGAYTYIKRLSPESTYEMKINNGKLSLKPMYIIIVFLVIICPLGLLAKGTAWGEWSKEELKYFVGYIPKGINKGFKFISLIPEYTISGVNEVVVYIISAIIGVLIIFGIIKFIVKNFKIDLKK